MRRIALLSIFALATGATSFASSTHLSAQSLGREERLPVKKTPPKPYLLEVCLVSGDKLGEMGKPVIFIHKGQEVKVCCKPCKKDFDENPERYLNKLRK